ncbi:MAG TPA: hypothetical protein VG734_25800 [Lacunisphaera sp.]|nr:hypothetical protein [Lacunisphaera sp.]
MEKKELAPGLLTPLRLGLRRATEHPFGKPLRAKLEGATAVCVFRSREDFTRLRRMLEINTHFNGAAEMLERVEAAVKLSTGEEFPVPRQLCQNGNMTLGLYWADFSMLVSSTTIVWRFARAGEPRAVNDAATEGVPVEVIQALAHIQKQSNAN